MKCVCDVEVENKVRKMAENLIWQKHFSYAYEHTPYSTHLYISLYM